MSVVNKRIMSLIEEQRISYRELSAETGIPKSALQRYATGLTEKIPMDRLERIADALHISAANLMGWEENKKPVPIAENELDAEKQHLIDLYDAASPELQAAALAVLRAAESKDKEKDKR